MQGSQSTRKDLERKFFLVGVGGGNRGVYHQSATGLTSTVFILSSSQDHLLLIAGEERAH